MSFRKDDEGKLRFDLLDPDFVEAIVQVLTHGAEKYSPDNWKKGDRSRYIAALGRHWNRYLQGEAVDFDSQLPTLGHIGCCLMFLHWMDSEEQARAYLDAELDALEHATSMSEWALGADGDGADETEHTGYRPHMPSVGLREPE